MKHVPSAHLLATLAGDVHPPWIVFVDRWLSRLLADPHWFMVVRLAPAALAVWLLSRVAMRRMGLRWPALAALHPIVFMYAAAARWYPAVFLMQALRAWALWGTRRRKTAWSAFALGGILGPMCGYADLAFLAHDCAWWVGRQGRQGRRKGAFLLVAGVALADVIVLASSPISLFRQLGNVAPQRQFARDAAEVLVTGIAGQALLPGFLGLSALAAVAGFGWAAWVILSKRRTRVLGLWLAAVTAGWLALGAVGYPQPRYGLLVWFLWTAAVLFAIGATTRWQRAVSVAAFAYALLALSLTVTQHYFVKGDLNEPRSELCDALASPSLPSVILAPYPRMAMQLAAHCLGHAPIVSGDWRAYVDPMAEAGSGFADVDAAVRGQRDVTLVTIPAQPETSMKAVNDAARVWLSAKCRPGVERFAVRDLHYPLKHALSHRDIQWRFAIQRWDCTGAGTPPVR